MYKQDLGVTCGGFRALTFTSDYLSLNSDVKGLGTHCVIKVENEKHTLRIKRLVWF